MEKKLSIISHKKAKSLVEKTAAMIFRGCAIISVLAVVTITGYMIISGTPAIFKEGITGILFSTTWAPTAAHPQYGIAYVILTSIVGVFLAICIGVPIGLFTAINLAEIAPVKLRKILKSAIELLAGIPSVVYGFIGLQVVVPFVRFIFGGTGFGILSGTFVLFVMILPTVTFMTTDALRAVPRHYREASLAMGATRWQTIWRVTLNAAKPGIFTAVIFGMARAFGEALAVQMVVGNSAVIPTSLTTPAATLTSVLTMGIGNTVMGTVSNNVLWSLALVLLLMSLGFNMLVKFITRERKRNYER